MMSNEYFLSKFRFDTAENEPAKNLQNFANFANFANWGAAGLEIGTKYDSRWKGVVFSAFLPTQLIKNSAKCTSNHDIPTKIHQN